MSIGFLFLTLNDIHPIWNKWFPNYDHVYIHSKTKLSDRGFSEKCISSIETNWGTISIVQAMIKLLQESLKNDQLKHFVFLSGNCVPLYDYIHVCDSISNYEKSSFKLYENVNRKERIKKYENEFRNSILRHSQWCILTRHDAEKLCYNDLTTHFKNVTIPDETYFGTVLNYFGIEINDTVTTCVNWSKFTKHNKGRSPHEYKHVNSELIHSYIEAFPNALFLRKISHSVTNVPYQVKYKELYELIRKENVHVISLNNV
jgi:hypothetical protein